MNFGCFRSPRPTNEPVCEYRPGSKERVQLERALTSICGGDQEIPLVIGGKRVKTDNRMKLAVPHNHSMTLGHYHLADSETTSDAIEAALKARGEWMAMPVEERASIFLKAADLAANKMRHELNASAMLSLSKTIHQAEIDIVCEMVDFWRFNVSFMFDIYNLQPQSADGSWNKMDWRSLEGFVFAVAPFNFASIAGNLPTAPAMLGNTVVWKPASSAVYPAWLLMQILEEAGLPPGVINFLPGPGATLSDVILKHRELAGIHFTGSTSTFRKMWQTVSQHIEPARYWPRIVGETGGKDFIFAHSSANIPALSTALIRGAFEFQGQKCSAASRAYVPASLWPKLKERLLMTVQQVKVGDVSDFTNFMGAVIDEKAFRNITQYISRAKEDEECEIITGGNFDESKGWFIEPTIIQTKNPQSPTMVEEIFGPVLTIYVYEDEQYIQTLELCDRTSPYALTGAVFSTDRKAIEIANEKLREAAGNFYINDKPTGAVVGQQPFGGARASGTNDKAGSLLNLLRWVSPRTIKETFNPPTEFRYPFMEVDSSGRPTLTNIQH